jgi:hypothetical protein
MVKHEGHRSQGARTARIIPCLQIMTAFEVWITHINSKNYNSCYDLKKPNR